MKSPLIRFGFLLLAAGLLAALAPFEKTLGANIRIVYLHGAWVWIAMGAFLLAAATGLLGLIRRRASIQAWSLALGRTGLVFWITFLLMSLFVMQSNWNGLFLDEPRFRIPFNFAVVGLLVQLGLVFYPNLKLASLANLIYYVVLYVAMRGADSVLHPISPIFSSGVGSIQLFFIGELLILALAAWQLSVWWLMMGRSAYPQHSLASKGAA